jgi:hypothetical protein
MRISLVLGIALILFSGWMFAAGNVIAGFIPLLIGGGLVHLALRPGRAGLILFGHICIFAGCLLITWGIYLLPTCRPTFVDILIKPLFWGLFSIFGGICSLFHGFCNCVRSCHTNKCRD